MEDVRGYEEHDPRVMDALKSGYPRFVVHAFVQKLIEFYQQREGLVGHAAVLVDGRRAADDLLAELGGQVSKWQVEEGIYLVCCDVSAEDLAKLHFFPLIYRAALSPNTIASSRELLASRLAP